ncbi:hypothetical protein SARC_03199 [Sphaeroforma arctica JP610]|uniref:Uncharacterized protein n=1 Tax=Sphaeroforma arctica JP610 TaxID=667725 RepID=A0A0L0G6E5_9EUKA|nr:hypothetical protein SARC_03199 [Sphaeroforma arctica JP610]KNC84580.1 hypothetical protein SARC_03199 [Sphaeroforma arctica JP610]|eukprot:XP_014158482.1 hypothetical protein SARC_03199 [Sphaeroforma arctica JP610]
MVRIYNATRNSVTGFSPYFHMTGRDLKSTDRSDWSYRTGCCHCSSRRMAVRDAVAAVRDLRAQLEQQSRANISREDVTLLPVGSQVWYRLRGKSHDLSARRGGPAKVVSVQALLTHVVEMARKFLRAELKLHIGKFTKEAHARTPMRYRPNGRFEDWLMYHSPLCGSKDGCKQTVGHCLRRTKNARTWSNAMRSVWSRWQMWCDEADLECYTPLVPGSGSKHVLDKRYTKLLKRMFSDEKKWVHFKRQVEKCFAFAQSARYRRGRLRAWGELQLSEDGVDMPARR